MQMEQFTTDAYPARQRRHAWREALHLHSLRPEMAHAAEPLYATLTACRTARGVGMARITSSPQTLRRILPIISMVITPLPLPLKNAAE